MKNVLNLNIVVLAAFAIFHDYDAFASSSCNSREHCAELCQAHEDALNNDDLNQTFRARSVR